MIKTSWWWEFNFSFNLMRSFNHSPMVLRCSSIEACSTHCSTACKISAASVCNFWLINNSYIWSSGIQGVSRCECVIHVLKYVISNIVSFDSLVRIIPTMILLLVWRVVVLWLFNWIKLRFHPITFPMVSAPIPCYRANGTKLPW